MEASVRGRKGATGFAPGVGHRPDTPLLLHLFFFSALAYLHQGVLQGCPCRSLPDSLLPCLLTSRSNSTWHPTPLQGQDCAETPGDREMESPTSHPAPAAPSLHPPWRLASWLRYWVLSDPSTSTPIRSHLGLR